MNATAINEVGVDVAKNVFQVYSVEAETGEIKNVAIKRAKFVEHFANRGPCLIGMEACGGSQHWARELLRLKQVKPHYLTSTGGIHCPSQYLI